ncbi:MAG: TerB family tellurite resistance protein [Hydrogenophaga sp.]|uniref:TerB family tellurite resistance protein n=1 Tax=Hydrogenophaga sp. TaxID=1904254 RepID=UPI002723C08D|nr:TerB family tellurite resistance protein [Hydrogenophaga sp.]MDO9568722.1 TerB family tellurite resistance protein [Hydrogenophaga sp.]
MRTYPTNSPQAATRLLAMALVADGNYSMTEIRALDRLEAPRRLGLPAEEIKAVIDQFCQDLLSVAHGEWTGSAQIDDATRQALMREVQDPALRVQIMELCEAVALADGHLAEGEADMLDAMVKAWRTVPAAMASATAV